MKKWLFWLKKAEEGFSMLELLIYVGIVGVIVSFAVPKYNNAVAMANTAKIQADLQAIDAAITMYQMQNGSNPANIETDLAEYIAHADQLKPPVGKCILKDTGVADITATEYVIADSGDEAELQGYTLDKFGKGEAKAS